jgi:putative PIN family toxin of toxin-antitoxin system
MFRDPRWQLLMEALISKEIDAITREDCRREFELVLAYDKMKLSAEAQAAILAEFDQRITLFSGDSQAMGSATSSVLPVCKDSDDQKFLELAQACSAVALVTKDKALLKLARKTARQGQFRIVSLEGWLRWHGEWTGAHP